MARNWPGLKKVIEECGETIVEGAKILVFPNGKHPARKRNLQYSLEDELADVLGSINYLIDRNGLDRKRIEKRAKNKYRKFAGWWGAPKVETPPVKKKAPKPRKK